MNIGAIITATVVVAAVAGSEGRQEWLCFNKR